MRFWFWLLLIEKTDTIILEKGLNLRIASWIILEVIFQTIFKDKHFGTSVTSENFDTMLTCEMRFHCLARRIIFWAYETRTIFEFCNNFFVNRIRLYSKHFRQAMLWMQFYIMCDQALSTGQTFITNLTFEISRFHKFVIFDKIITFLHQSVIHVWFFSCSFRSCSVWLLCTLLRMYTNTAWCRSRIRQNGVHE